MVPSGNHKLMQGTKKLSVTTTDGVTYRKTQAHLTLYRPQDKPDEDNAEKYHMQTLIPECKKVNSNDNLAQFRSKRNIKPPVKFHDAIVDYK